ncbi:MAG TPA: IS66 family insertion sequence element accessory protein TnpB [Terriglobia bacterium]|nr:IS66 family insertion sequence element accessory protein TnpB [Terriglobia bacterium]
MIQVTPQMRILVAIEAVDGRKGIDSLARLCQEKLTADPFSGCLFECLQECTRRGERKSPSADHPSLSSPQWQTI